MAEFDWHQATFQELSPDELYRIMVLRQRVFVVEQECAYLDADGFDVLIDSVSVDYMAGSEIDFSDELIGAAFKINNPNATASCGCGTSFSL